MGKGSGRQAQGGEGRQATRGSASIRGVGGWTGAPCSHGDARVVGGQRPRWTGRGQGQRQLAEAAAG